MSGEQIELKKEENLGDLTQVPFGTWSQILWVFSFFHFVYRELINALT